MSVEQVLRQFELERHLKQRVAYTKVIEEKKACHCEIALKEPFQRYLKAKGIRLYSHQCKVIELLRAGKNVIITTPTASGKTLAFSLPVFEKVVEGASALYIYPTKALTNDQLKFIKEVEELAGLQLFPAIYDGDTPTSKRGEIREKARIVLTNPYELHQVLPWHAKWQRFFKSVKFVVLDEAHRYRGVFGSNVALLLRRLRRVCERYGSNPQFVLSSATLANPLEFSKELVGLDFELVSEDGSPRGRKYFILYNPYFDGKGTLSAHQETAKLLELFVKNGVHTLVFTVSRKMAELIARWTRQNLKASNLPEHVVSTYRAGYLPEERRQIENALKKGELLGVVSTNALELGIDIGSLDAVIISGYPGTVISTWQQAGRAGRGLEQSLAVLVAFQNPLDQFFMRHPEAFFGKPHEHAIINTKNPYILSAHALCAASEFPLKQEDKKFFGEELSVLTKKLCESGLLRETRHGFVYAGTVRATELAKLDNISNEVFRVLCDGKLLETLDVYHAYREAHEGAVLLHQAESYLVKKFDLQNKVVEVTKMELDYHTEPLYTTDISVVNELRALKHGEQEVHLGEVSVTEQYIGYKIVKYDDVVAIRALELPPLSFNSVALWYTIDELTVKKIEEESLDLAGGLHAAEHAMIGVMPFHVLCDRWDIGGVSTPLHPYTGEPTIFIYDGYEGGIGISEKAAELFPELVRTTLQVVSECGCERGCPACIYSPKCGNDNRPLDKRAAKLILESVLRKLTSEV